MFFGSEIEGVLLIFNIKIMKVLIRVLRQIKFGDLDSNQIATCGNVKFPLTEIFLIRYYVIEIWTLFRYILLLFASHELYFSKETV